MPDRAPLRAPVVVMAFDEQGQPHSRAQMRDLQAPTTSLSEVGSRRDDIILIPSVFASATGWRSTTATASPSSKPRAGSGANLPHCIFPAACRTCRSRFAATSPWREAMAFGVSLSCHQGRHGHGIVNAGQWAIYDDLDPELREACEDVCSTGAADAASGCCARAKISPGSRQGEEEADLAGVAGRSRALSHALVHGITEFIEADVEEARHQSNGRCM